MSIWSAISKRYRDIDSPPPRRRLKSRGQGKGERWTEKEDALIRKWYTKKPTAWLADKLRRSVPAVRSHAKRLGIKYETKRRWIAEEDALLKKWYAEKPVDWIADQLGRNVNAVRCRAKLLGVHKNILGRTHRNLAIERLNREEPTFLG